MQTFVSALTSTRRFHHCWSIQPGRFLGVPFLRTYDVTDDAWLMQLTSAAHPERSARLLMLGSTMAAAVNKRSDSPA